MIALALWAALTALQPVAAPVAAQTGCPSGGGRVVDVSSGDQLRAALGRARPGEVIRMASGVYGGEFRAEASGTASARITLCGSRNAVLRGGSTRRGYGLYLSGSYWTLRGFTVTGSQFGVYLVGARRNLLDDLTIEGIGQEAVRFRSFSSDNVLRNSRIRNTGLLDPEYGEGVYIGTYRGQWGEYSRGRPDASDDNQILDNTFGPDVRAEHIDVKEGTSGGVIRGNTFLGAGMVQSRPWVDSWVEIKGNRYTVAGNRGQGAIRDGFQVRAELEGWGRDNLFSGNRVDLGRGSGYAVRVDAPGNVVRCDNVAVGRASRASNVGCR